MRRLCGLSKTNQPILATTILLIAVISGCGPRKVETIDSIERGTLRCVERVERRQVNNYWWELFADNRPFIPQGRESNIVGSCRTSRNPGLKVIVFLLGDSCWRFHTEGGVAGATRLQGPRGMDSVEQFKTAIWSCNGRCLVWSELLVFVDTGEAVSFRHRLPDDLIGLSPDLKTAVAAGPQIDSAHVTLQTMDIETGAVTSRTLERSMYPWLLDYREGRDAIAEHFKWSRSGVLVFP